MDKILNGIGRSRQSDRISQLELLLQHSQEATEILPHAARPVLRESTDLYGKLHLTKSSFIQWCGDGDEVEQDAAHLVLQHLKTTGKNSISPVPCSFLLAIKDVERSKLQ